MFRSPNLKSRAPAIDLATVRDTISYMQDDIAHTPGLERVASALRAAMAEIDRLEPERDAPAAPVAARFMSWQRS